MGKIIFDLRVRQRGDDTRQASVENAASDAAHWDESYVDFSGFFGDLGPHMFAAAPDMLIALKSLVDGFDPANARSDDPAYIFFASKAEQALAAIAKAEGRS